MSRDAGDCLGVPGGNQPLHIQGYESGKGNSQPKGSRVFGIVFTWDLNSTETRAHDTLIPLLLQTRNANLFVLKISLIYFFMLALFINQLSYRQVQLKSIYSQVVRPHWKNLFYKFLHRFNTE